MIKLLGSKHGKTPKSFCFFSSKIILFVGLWWPTNISVRAQTPVYSSASRFHPVVANSGMVATQSELATAAGLKVLQEGGNAIDAAVTVGFTLAVTLPRAGNLGGGGFMLVYLADREQAIAIDYREVAPLAATSDMFVGPDGEVDQQKSRNSHLAVGVPGTVAGLTLALEKYGTISLKRALQPAIELAEQGFVVDADLHDTLVAAYPRMKSSQASVETYYLPGGRPYQVGDTFKQPDKARSLRLIAQQGSRAFYRGAIARSIVAEMRRGNGLITKQDLASYQPVIREPVEGSYRGYKIHSMPPPSSGGIHLIQMLNILELFPLQKLGHNSAATIHRLTETMKLAYADRYKYLGDSDFVDVPVEQLVSKSYARRRYEKINPHWATPSDELSPGKLGQIPETNETTHFSVVDRFGNAVANTYTLNFSYGSAITVPGTGILLNNQMDDFTAKVGEANAFGLVGGEKNAIAPRKRMLSSMTPTIVTQGDEVFLVTGSPGGSRIITTTLQIISNLIDHQMNVAEATNAPRVHHQWYPDRLRVETGISLDTIWLLETKGHQVYTDNAIGSTQSIVKIDGILYGASDPRRRGALTLGY